MAEQGEQLLLAESSDYCSYDDDDLQAAARLRRRRNRLRGCIWMTCGVLIIALVGVGVFFGTNGARNSSSIANVADPLLGKYRHAAVASDVTQCSQIGRDIMEEQKGNAVDAAVASLLCMGLADPQSMGIGGGFFMTIYNRSTGRSWSIDARETAPAAATPDMFYHGENSKKGGLSIAVPGEIRGYQAAMHYGRLPWKQVFQPAMDMAKKGFQVPHSLESALDDFYRSHNFTDIDDLKTRYPQFGKVFVNPDTNRLYRTGEIITMPLLGATLETIATEGAEAFYNGTLTQDIVQEFKQAGGIITAEDLRQYQVLVTDSFNVTLRNQYTIHGPVTPSSGVILMFILNILDGYNMKPVDVATTEGRILAYHRIVEAFKFAYASRTDLADAAFVPNVTQLVQNLTSRAYADAIRAKIWDNQTHDYTYYGGTFDTANKTSTAHLSVIDPDGNAVSVTSTVNARFGSEVIGNKTGVIWNDEMDDFATSDKPNEFDVYPSPANRITPGKRPLSSMCPAVFVDEGGEARLVVGAAGGSRITTATAWVAAHVMWLGENIQQGIDSLRLHHQLLPPHIMYEEGTSKAILDGLKAKGHNLTCDEPGLSIVQGITRDGGFLYANSDHRKGGTPAGF